MAALVNRAHMKTATTGTGTITLTTAVTGRATFAEAGLATGATVSYTIEDGDNFEIGRGTYTTSGLTLTRAAILLSKIGGVAGTTALTLSGGAEVFVSPTSEDLQDADNDTYFDWDTDDVLKLYIGAAQDFTFNANEFDVLVGSEITISGDGSAIGAVNGITWGVGDDGSIYSDGTNLTIDVAAQLEIAVAGTEVGHWDAGGINLVTGDQYEINETAVLTSTTLGSGIVNSSLTNFGTLTSVVVDDITIDANSIVSSGSSSMTIVPLAGQSLVLDGSLDIDGPIMGYTGNFTVTGDVVFNGEFDLNHTATLNDDHAFEIAIDAAGFGDVKALDIDYITGAISAGEEESVILINIDETAATGGHVHGIEVLTTTGGADQILAMFVGAGVGVVHQNAGSFADPTTGTNNTASTDIADMIDGSTGTTTTILVSNSDYIIIGAANEFTEIEFIFNTTVSNPGIQPTFAYSTGADTFTTFSPTDGTNGFRNTGVVSWESDELTSHIVNTTTGTFDIKITRNSAASGSASLYYAKTATTVNYFWTKDGDVTVNTVDAKGLYMIERSAASADVTVQGQLWVKDDNPNKLRYTDGDGTDFTIATTADLTAEDLDVQGDSGTMDIDLDSDTLDIAGGSGIVTSAATTTLTVDMDINELSVASIASGDFVPFWDITATATNKKITFANFEGTLDHDSLSGFVANEHIDHSGVSVTAGTGLTGGGTIAATRTINLDINTLSADTPVLADTFAFEDTGGGDDNKATLTVLNGILIHDNLTGFVANEHIDWTSTSSNFNTSGTVGTGAIDATVANITTGGKFIVDVDGTTGSAGSMQYGASADAELFYTSGNVFNIRTNTASSTINLNAEGDSITLQMSDVTTATFSLGGLNLVSGDAYTINGNSVLNATTLGSAVVSSSLTRVGVLNDGSISAGFGDIDNGTNNITTGGQFIVDVDGTSGSAGASSWGLSKDAELYYAVGNVFNIRTNTAGSSINLNAEGDSITLQMSDVTTATFDLTGLTLAVSDALAFGSVDVLSDSSGTMTLSNIDALDPTTESTIEAAIDTLESLTSIQTLTVTMTDAGTDAFWGWDDTASAYENLTATEATAILNVATASLKGTVELATAGEITTGTDTARSFTPDAFAGSDFGKVVLSILVFDDSETCATGDGAGDVFWRVPSTMNGMNLVEVAGQVNSTGTTNTMDVTIQQTTVGGATTDMLSTALTIDSGERDSSTALNPPVIDTGADDIATGDRLRINVDAVHSTPATGFIIELTFQLP